MGDRIISVTIQFNTEVEKIDQFEIDNLINKTITTLVFNSNFKIHNPVYNVKIWREDG